MIPGKNHPTADPPKIHYGHTWITPTPARDRVPKTTDPGAGSIRCRRCNSAASPAQEDAAIRSHEEGLHDDCF